MALKDPSAPLPLLRRSALERRLIRRGKVGGEGYIVSQSKWTNERQEEIIDNIMKLNGRKVPESQSS